ncbi:hypothetical protein BT69DRAFT_1277134 [Atractiella rhizophila]|nr:hypothetical protein BT69DRAFT_1277134 [Atractiella rhizophila]
MSGRALPGAPSATPSIADNLRREWADPESRATWKQAFTAFGVFAGSIFLIRTVGELFVPEM